MIFVLNAQGITLRHLAKLTPNLVASAISLLATSAPIRIDAIHILYPPPGSEWLLSFAQSLIKEKLALRVNIKYFLFTITEFKYCIITQSYLVIFHRFIYMTMPKNYLISTRRNYCQLIMVVKQTL